MGPGHPGSAEPPTSGPGHGTGPRRGGGHGHGHSARKGDGFEVARTPRIVLLAALALAALATIVGGLLVWPDGDRAAALREEVEFAAPGVTFPDAEVLAVGEPCADPTGPPGEDGCGQLEVRVSGGAFEGDLATVAVPPEVSEAGLQAGDEVRLIRNPATPEAEALYNYFGTDRSGALLVMTLLFVVIVLAVARFRGLMALVGLLFSGAAIIVFMLPALTVGENGLVVGLVGSSAILFVVLYTTHGFSIRTSAAIAGTLVGVLMTAGIGAVAVGATRLTGIAGESGVLRSLIGDLDFQGLFTCAIIVAGLGVLNDVTITQSSAVWELRAAAPGRSRRAIFVGAMRIGRDHIASTIYTIVFAYAGTALTVLMLLQLYGLPVDDLLATEEVTQEIVRSLASSIALVLAVPVTTAIAAVTVPGADEAQNRARNRAQNTLPA